MVQTDNEVIMSGFNPFDAKLGTLNKVTLDIAVSKSRVWRVGMPAIAPVDTTIATTPTGRGSCSRARPRCPSAWR